MCTTAKTIRWGLYRGLYRGVLQGLLRGMLGVQTLNPKPSTDTRSLDPKPQPLGVIKGDTGTLDYSSDIPYKPHFPIHVPLSLQFDSPL